MKRRGRGILLVFVAILANALASPCQSLAEAARREAERRQKLDREGIREKRIEAADAGCLAPGAAISIFSPGPGLAEKAPAAPKAAPGATLRSFQTRLLKLDRDIQQGEERLKQLKARAEAERWKPLMVIGGSRGAGLSPSPEQLRGQILELEGKLKLWRQDRMDIFQAGRKAGYLPGELEGRGGT